MNKEKQIEEIKRDIKKALEFECSKGKCKTCKHKNEDNCEIPLITDYLIEQGYQKLHKDSDKIDELLKDYGIGDDVTSRINLRLGVTEKDIEIMAKALREYAKNHPNPKCHANEANVLAHLIEYQRRKIEE